MRSPLNKRLPREFKGEFGKYAVIFLFMLLTIGFVSGFLVAGDSMIVSYDESFDKYQIEHGHFVTKEEISASVLRKLETEGTTIEKLYYKDEDIDREAGGTMRLYKIRENMNLICVMDGKLPEHADEIGIDRMFAENCEKSIGHALKVGDTISIAGKTYKVTALVAFSDYSALFSDNNDTMFDAIQFGVGCVTKEAFDQISDAKIHYQYSFRYEKEPADDREESEWSDDFLKNLAEQAFRSDMTIESYIPRYGNQAIRFTGDDMGGDRQMMIVLLYIIIVIMAFVFSVNIKHSITKEASVIGTLRALGYTKAEMFFHYIATPVFVSLIAAIFGNVLGYTIFKDIVADMYYGSYSLPTFETLWNADAFILTTVYPIIIMIVTNAVVLVNKLQLSPLRFLRRDLSVRQRKKAIRLPHIKFFSRFRIRIVLQNRSNYVTLLVGIIFADVLMMFGLMMGPIINNYADDMLDNMLAKYQYVLKSQVETENSSAEKYCMTSLSYHGKERNEDVGVYGIVENSKYIESEMPEDGVLVSDGFSEKYEVKPGDVITLYESFGTETYELKVSGIMSFPGSIAVFMSRQQYLDIFEPKVEYMDNLMSDPALFFKQYASPDKDEYFTGYFSDEELTDLDDKYVMSCITEEDYTKLSRQMEVSMGSIFGMIKYFAMALAALLIYLLTKVVLEKNANSISMVKILGYENGEIARLYLLATTAVVTISVLAGMGISALFMINIWRMFMVEFNGWISVSIPAVVYPQMFGLMMLAYVVVGVLQFRKIQRIPMEDALKNVE